MSEPLDDAPDGPLAAFLENAQARHSTYAPAQISRLARLYGNRLDAMLEAPASALEDTLTGALAPHLAAQVSYAVSQEMAVCLDDVVLRRVCDGQTGGLDDSQIGAIAAYMTARLGWSSAEKNRQIKNLNLALNIA